MCHSNLTFLSKQGFELAGLYINCLVRIVQYALKYSKHLEIETLEVAFTGKIAF